MYHFSLNSHFNHSSIHISIITPDISNILSMYIFRHILNIHIFSFFLIASKNIWEGLRNIIKINLNVRVYQYERCITKMIPIQKINSNESSSFLKNYLLIQNNFKIVLLLQKLAWIQIPIALSLFNEYDSCWCRIPPMPEKLELRWPRPPSEPAREV